MHLMGIVRIDTPLGDLEPNPGLVSISLTYRRNISDSHRIEIWTIAYYDLCSWHMAAVIATPFTKAMVRA
jgi:hypothetical protein